MCAPSAPVGARRVIRVGVGFIARRRLAFERDRLRLYMKWKRRVEMLLLVGHAGVCIQ